MVLGAQRQNVLGAVVLCTSPDGLHWSPGGAIGLSEEYQMMECHDLFELDGAPVLLYCPQHRDNTADATLDSFSVGRVLEQWPDAARPLDLDTDWQRLDDGFDFYAPQTFRNRILQNERILKQHRILLPADTAGRRMRCCPMVSRKASRRAHQHVFFESIMYKRLSPFLSLPCSQTCFMAALGIRTASAVRDGLEDGFCLISFVGTPPLPVCNKVSFSMVCGLG